MIERALQIISNAKDRLSEDEYTRLVVTLGIYSDFQHYDFNDAILTLLTQCEEANKKGEKTLHFIDEKNYTKNSKLIPVLNSFGFDIHFLCNTDNPCPPSLRLHWSESSRQSTRSLSPKTSENYYSFNSLLAQDSPEFHDFLHFFMLYAIAERNGSLPFMSMPIYRLGLTGDNLSIDEDEDNDDNYDTDHDFDGDHYSDGDEYY